MTDAVSDAPASIETLGYKQELKRSLSLLDLLVYGLVFIVPTAPFAVFGFVYNASKGMVPLVYAVGLVAMFMRVSWRKPTPRISRHAPVRQRYSAGFRRVSSFAAMRGASAMQIPAASMNRLASIIGTS